MANEKPLFASGWYDTPRVHELKQEVENLYNLAKELQDRIDALSVPSGPGLDEAPDGSSGSPAFGFASDPNTGMFLSTADKLGFSAGGTTRLEVGTGAIDSIEPFRGGFESAGSPTFAFSSETDTGMFRPAPNTLGLSAGGTERVRVNPASPYLEVNDGSFRTVWHDGNVQVTSNANGTSLRFPNGVQICYHRVNLGARNSNGSGTYADPWRTSAVDWTFPQAFSATPHLYLSPDGNSSTAAARGMTVHAQTFNTTSVTSVQATATSSAAGSHTIFASMLAVGTWA